MRLRLFIATAVVLSVSWSAHADTFSTFNVNGVLQSAGSLSGTLTLDNATGQFSDLDVFTVSAGRRSSIGPERTYINQQSNGGDYDLDASYTPGAGLSIELALSCRSTRWRDTTVRPSAQHPFLVALPGTSRARLP